MTYNLEPVDQAELAGGHRWMFILEPDGEMHFVCDREGGPIPFPTRFAGEIVALLGEKMSAVV